ncbi:hypothetical protein HMPREF1322_1598 [Porphyromonas gingivalis W50]|nr:hypothetical protein HMPREF1322_1598 [Porphyromonas gingivalis W50]
MLDRLRPIWIVARCVYAVGDVIGLNSLAENPIAQLADSHNYYCRLICQNYNAMRTKIYKKPIGEL